MSKLDKVLLAALVLCVAGICAGWFASRRPCVAHEYRNRVQEFMNCTSVK